MPFASVVLFRCFILVSSFFILPTSVTAQAPINTLEVSQAGPDFPFQGEYSGVFQTDRGETKLGLQVIGLGNGKFEVKAFKGGLPGDGWDGEEAQKGAGLLQDGVVTLSSERGTAILQEGTATIMDPNEQFIGKLKQIIRKSETLGQKPPKQATVLFDGSSADQFVNGKMSPEGWLIQGTKTKQDFGSGKLHLEFLLPFKPDARGQGRGNSGCYLQSRYEVQVLDSFGLSGEHNECGGIYSLHMPAVNMCFPPLSWQTYDIDFTAAKFDPDGKKTANARMTVKHNGVVIHEDVEVPKSTTASPLKEGPEGGPLYLQDHGNQIRYRNIWFVPVAG